MEILTVKNLSFTYAQCTRRTLKDVSFGMSRGDLTAVCGATGSGKTTLLRLIKRELSPVGEKSGVVYYKNTPVEDLGEREAACSIGFVMQNPQQQLVTDKVWHELAFGLESLGVPSPVIRRRVAEMASYFGIEDWFDKSVNELSGGQKQLLNLASVMVMQPELLILDEPTAQLDPIAASEFLTTVKKLNTELSLSVIITEHRLEDVIPMCDKLLVMDNGAVNAFGEVRRVCDELRARGGLNEAMPAAVRLFGELGGESGCPLTVKEGRRFIQSNYGNETRALPPAPKLTPKEPVLELHDVWFKYSRQSADVLRGTRLEVYGGEILCILGGNGSGKTTALNVCAGLLQPYSGSVRVLGKSIKNYKGASLYKNCIAALPQEVQTVFLKSTVRLELESAGADIGSMGFDLTGILDRHPYDLSGGEQQLAALARVLAQKPRILLLDEPTKGLDAHSKLKIAGILKALSSSGVAVVAVTHDVEFASLCAHRCALFFRGEIVCCDEPHAFFSGNSFYTTAANRMTREYFDGVITVDEAVRLCKLNSQKGGGGE